MKKCVVEARLSRLEEESAKYAGYSEFVERVFGNVEGLTDQFGRFMEMHNSVVKKVPEEVTPMKTAVLEMAGTVGAVRKEIGAERGRIDGLASLALPRLDTTSGAVEELWKQMTEHRRYCGEILRELRGYATAGLQHSRNMGVDAVQNVAEGKGSDTGTAESDERTAEIQRLQGEVRMLQEAVGNVGVEVQWVAQGGESRAQSLQRAMEDVWGEVSLGGFRSRHRG